jgi:putative ATP-dependent endonuclease of OLD family
MFLANIRIRNFRGIQDLSLDLDELTVLIGSNNTGKTTILDALQFCLSRSLGRRGGVFSTYDYHLLNEAAQPQDAQAIEITVTFIERREGEWPDELIQVIPNAIGIADDSLQTIVFRITSKYDTESGDFLADWEFLDPKGNPLDARARNNRYPTELQRLAPVFYLAALRDAAQQFRAQSPFWGPFVRSLKMETAERDEIEAALAALNRRVLDSHEAFAPVLESLKQTARLVPLGGGDAVSIEAVPAKVFDMLSRTQVLLSGKTGARLPIGRHGEGTQSLAVICLFGAFLAAKLADGYSPQTEPILALEEPEAHLHPSAVRAVGSLLSGLRGQKIIATHSGDLLAALPLTAIRRLSRTGGTIRVHRVKPDALNPEEIRKLDHHVRLSRGSLLFARFWLLVEGESEVLLLKSAPGSWSMTYSPKASAASNSRLLASRSLSN